MSKPSIEQVSESRCFEGRQIVYKHASSACDCTMRFAVYLPPAAERGRVPALYWLSGLTCTEDNFSVKAGAQRYAAELGLALIIPDTSPRGVNIPGEDAQMDVGTGAGFYVNATEAPWAANLPIDPARKSISGHSMGGHGAIIIGIGNPLGYCSVSAFAPIASASQSAWGQHALTAYLGDERQRWLAYDAAAVIRAAPSQHELLVDQGMADPYLDQLRPNALKEACSASGQRLTYRERAGYDHGYYFVSTFIAEHLRFHAAALR
jgi:S-formylglutathione hydrolase